MCSAITATSSSWLSLKVRGAHPGAAAQAWRVAASSAPARVGAEIAPPRSSAPWASAWRRVIRSSCSMLSSSLDAPPDARGRGVLGAHGLVVLAVARDLRRRVHDPHRAVQRWPADHILRQDGIIGAAQLRPRLVRLDEVEGGRFLGGGARRGTTVGDAWCGWG